uniref:C2H2-type domain-containing protein n=2 Tax=Caenorhabditis tropicalis TaxID=1561998 RepID=A0A1I7TDK8_9PELO
MRTMDQGQLQKLLSAAAAVSTTPQPTANPMMLFSSMTSQATTPPSPASSSGWPLKSTPTSTLTSQSIDANLAALILLQAFQSQQAALASVTVPTTPILASPTPSSAFIPSTFSLPLFTSTTVPTSLPTPTLTPTAIPTSVTPQSTTPPGVFNTLNSLLQIPTQLETTSVMSKCSTPPIIIQPSTTPRKVSSVSMPPEFVPVIPTPSASGSGSLPASSPSTSSKKEEEDEEEEEEEFVDIESVDVAIDGKEKRRAHVEFYRRMKYMRQQDKALQCGICKEKVENHENMMAVHVAGHADAGCYQCRLCGWQAIDKYKIYTHMRVEHPRKVDMFVDKRDMPKMCLFLSQCFPKTSSRPKKESNRNADTYLTEILRGSAVEQTCHICKGSVKRDKAAMIRHVQTNHTIK